MRAGLWVSCLIIVVCVMALPSCLYAQGFSIIRDTETENVIKKMSAPVLKAAGLAQNQVNIALVNRSEINAFVAGGANIFLFAGLIQKADYPEEVIGVIAHEVGHIAGGHLIAGRQAMERASYQSILATVLGIGAAVASGDGSAAAAIGAGGSEAARRGFFAHSRVHESAADQAALKYLEDANINPEGLVTFMRKLEGEELLPASQQSEYVRTHPLTRNRIDALERGYQHSAHTDKRLNQKDYESFDRIRAKLIAFRMPQQVTRLYQLKTGDVPAQYAHAIMHYRQKRYDKAIQMMDVLVKKHPNDPYFREMKGQFLRDSGDLQAAEKQYRKALKLLNDKAPLIQMALAHILIEQDKNPKEAQKRLNQALQIEKRDARSYRLLATLAGRAGKKADVRYYLAEEAVSLRKRAEANRLINLALDEKGLSSDIRIKAQDLKSYLDGLPKEKK